MSDAKIWISSGIRKAVLLTIARRELCSPIGPGLGAGWSFWLNPSFDVPAVVSALDKEVSSDLEPHQSRINFVQEGLVVTHYE
jgi:hypothetical protein